jgi:aspartyl-tRNA(Asn)/glutamyl-tRNA(Gln) amidotransferase subunit C
MPLNQDEVRHVARLSRLALEPEELRRMTEDLQAVLEHMEILSQVDTSEVLPTYHIDPPADPWRSDVQHEGLERERMLRAAPEAVDGQVRVPRILEDAP